MLEENTLEIVKEIIMEQLGVEIDEIHQESLFIDDFGADSLEIVELIMAFEEKFGIEIPDEVSEKVKTVQDILDYLTTLNDDSSLSSNEGETSEEIDQKYEKVTTSEKLIDALNSILLQKNIPDFLKTLNTQIIENTDFDFAVTVLRRNDGEELEYYNQINLSENCLPVELQFKLSIGPLEAILFKQDKNKYFQNLKLKKNNFQKEVINYIESLLIIPIVNNGLPVGMIYVGFAAEQYCHKFQSEGKPNTNDIKFINKLKLLCTQALHNLLTIGNISSINNFTGDILKIYNREELFNNIYSTLKKVVPSTVSAVILPKDNQLRDIEWVTGSNVLESTLKDGSFINYFQDDLRKKLFDNSSNIELVERYSRFIDFPKVKGRKIPKLQAAKIVPFNYGAPFPGYIVILGNYLRIYEKEDNEIVSLIVNIFATALNRIETESNAKERIISHLEKGFQEAVHKMKQPIGILDHYLSDINKYKEYELVDKCIDKVEECKRLMAKFKNLAKKVEPSIRPHKLHPLIEDTIKAIFVTKKKSIQFDFQLEQTITIDTDINLLKDALKAVLENAESFCLNNEKVVISVKKILHRDIRKNLSAKPNILIEITNTGVSISDSIRKHLFEPGVSSRESDDHSGFGLYFSSKYINALGGEIKVNQISENVTFTISLPITNNLEAV